MINNNILSELVNELSKEILNLGKECKEFGSVQGKILYRIIMKSFDEEKLYYSDNENLIADVLDAIELEYKFIPFGKELLINADEIIAIEKVGE
ncbi:MAG: hypothetical protein E6876_04350 [Clostridium sp.]|nr:hypothetical protein [Clostridium sp.]